MLNRMVNGVANQKMGFRLLTSFMILVIFVSTIVSGLSFYQFRQLSTTLEDIAEYQIPVAENATNVERFILSALDFEKTYLATNDSQYRENTIKSINSASLSLSELIRLAEKFDDKALDAKSSNIWLSVESYRQSFLKVVSIIEENRKVWETIRESGEVLSQTAFQFINSTLSTENDSLMNDSLTIGFEINQSILTLQRLETDFLLNQNAETVEEIHSVLVVMEDLYDQLNTTSTSSAGPEMVTNSREALKNYREALDAYAQNHIELLSLKQGMQNKGQEIQQISRDVQKTNWETMQAAQTASITQMNAAKQQLIIVLVISFLLAVLMARQLTISITRPLTKITEAAKRISNGDLLRDTNQSDRNVLIKRKDEIGDIAAAFETLINYLQNIGSSAAEVAKGNLAVKFQAVSSSDELGYAFQEMVRQLRLSMLEVSHNTTKMKYFSDEMAQIVAQSDSAASQISTTMEQVAQGTTEQSSSVQQVFTAIKLSQNAMGEMVSGFDQQMITVNKGAQISNNLATAVEHVSEDMSLVVKESERASQVAQHGAEKIGSTLKNIKGIQIQVEQSQDKVSAMQAQTNKIGGIVETIEEIASQTNLLAINATIEAAHAESDSKVLTEAMLERFMLAACEMIARLLECSGEIPQSYWVEMGKLADIDQILITDEDGVIRIGNDPALIGFRFPEDNPQTAEFRALIGKRNGRVCQPAQMRAADKQVYKYAGISRRDQPGVVQVGYNMSTLSLFNFQIGGFTVVAREVYQLAESSRTATKEIRLLIKAIIDAANAANLEMEKSVRSVKNSLIEAENAGNNLNDILTAFAHVSEQADRVADATVKMKGISSEFRSAIFSIQDVVVENSKITKELRLHTDDMANLLDRIASVSEENSAATEEVTAATKELQDQISGVSKTADQLNDMANHLSKIVAQFDLEL